MKKFSAECFGTFCLVFAGTGAIVINNISGGSITHVGVALTFGLVVLSMIYAVGDISGAHLNPAVTIGFFAARRFSGQLVLPYILSQSLGALAASLLLRGLMQSWGQRCPPALVSGQFASLWLYLAAPTLGALLGVGLCRCMREEGCCGSACQD